MGTFARGNKAARLGVEALEDRLTPVVAYTLGGVGVGTANLISFDTTTPNITSSVPITNLVAGETLVGIDFRPQNGHLYALGVNATGSGTLYDISVRTGFAGRVGTPGGVTTTDGLVNPQAGGTYAFDFNPRVDLIRVLGSDGDNFVIDPNSGTTAANQTAIVNQATLQLSGNIYTNNQPNNLNGAAPTNATTQYAIGAGADSLYIIPVPSNGVSNLVGSLGIGDFSAVNGFDVQPGVNDDTSGTGVATGTAQAILTVNGTPRLYNVDLTTGAASLVGTVGNGAPVNGLAIHNDYNGYSAIGIGGATPGAANIVRFNTNTPGTSTTVAITGINAGDTLVGSAIRPATGQLYALGVTAGGVGTLYLINPETGAVITATTLTPGMGVTIPTLPNPATAGVGYGFAFNATVDAIRIITTANQSLAVLPTGVVAAVSPNVQGATVDSATYTNAFGQTAGVGNPTTLYVLDSATDRLLRMNPATGVTTPVGNVTVGGTTLNFSAVTGFDAAAGVTTVGPNGTAVTSGVGYAVLVVGGTPILYRIDLTTGAATNLGTAPSTLSGFSLSDTPGGTVNVAPATATGNEGGTVALTLTRNASTGPQTVSVSYSGSGSASDVTGTAVATFADGVTTTTLNIPLAADQTTEGTETLITTINVPGGARGTSFTSTITVNDTSTTPAPVTPPPVFTGATTIGNFLVLTGSGGTQVVQLPPGSVAIYADLSGDGVGEVILFLPTLVTVIDGQTGRFSLLSFDDNGDGFRDLLVFNLDGTTTRTDGRTGLVTQM